jgi:hypothetical protein
MTHIAALTIWQRNFHQHSIRNGIELRRICASIVAIPVNWIADPENPVNLSLAMT